MTASTWLSNKWPSAAFGTRAVIRCYVGGVGAEDVLDADDAELIEACARFRPPSCRFPTTRARRRCALAPLDAAVRARALDRAARIRAALPPGIFVTGQAYDGVGSPTASVARAIRPRPSSRISAAPPNEGDGSMNETIYALYPVFAAQR